MEPNVQTRDYDKDPIVIKDVTHKLSLFLFVFSMFCLYIVVLTIPDTQFTQTNLIISVSIFVLPVLYKTFPSLNQKNEIILSDTQIERHWGESEKMITWSSNTTVEKTFIDFFDEEQADASWQRYIGAVFNLFIEHPLSLIAKILFHLFSSGLGSYRFFDTLIIRDNDKMIAILMTKNQDYLLIKEFLLKKGIEIDQLSMFYTPLYLSLESATKN